MSTARKLESEVSSLVVRPLEPTIGAEISGVDISQPISDEVRDEIKRTILQYKVVFFRDQHLDEDSHAAFAARFGRLYTHPNTTRSEKIASIHKIQATDFARYERAKDPTTVEAGYHTDTSWRLAPTWGAVLRAVTLPEVGGDTVWVDAAAAYDGLSEELKQRLEGLFVTHDFREALQRAGHDYPIVAHPIVRTHRETGRKTPWVNFTQRPHVIGVDLADGRALLQQVLAAYQKPEYQVRFAWRPNSVAFWDNRAAVHIAVRNYGDFPRVLERILIQDEVSYENL
ncbi:MAG: taurine catabolism dioxygenase TauD [Myxococcaceae bacterium]|nr:taurine catabolism dioxygenase TauD [Myxococcaceae bacterium]